MKKLIALSLSIVAAGCFDKKTSPEDQILIELVPVGQRSASDPLGRITVGDYRADLARLRFEREETLYAKALPAELKAMVLEHLIDQRLMAIEAKDTGVKASTTAVEHEIAAMKRSLSPRGFERILIDTYQTEADMRQALAERLAAIQLVEREAMSKVKVTDAELQAIFEAKPEAERVRKARVHARQIVVRTEEDGKRVEAALKKKEDFGDLARRFSIAPEGATGGDLGWFEEEQMPKVFDDMCFPLQPNQVSPLTASEYGYHLCQVLARESERPLTFEEARTSLLRDVQAERTRTAQTELITTLRSRVNVVKNEQALAEIE